MPRSSRSLLGSLVALALLGAPGLALATADPLGDLEFALPAAGAAGPLTMSTDDMAEMSAGQDVNVDANVAISEQHLRATASDNDVVAGSLTHGQVTFAPDNFAGIGNFVINTGTNSILQGSISVSIATGSLAP